jgi:hypothetical protein
MIHLESKKWNSPGDHQMGECLGRSLPEDWLKQIAQAQTEMKLEALRSFVIRCSP